MGAFSKLIGFDSEADESYSPELRDVSYDYSDEEQAADLVEEDYYEEAEVDHSRIVTIRPVRYEDSRIIGEHVKQNVPVILNLSDADENARHRIVDFCSGLVHGRDGNIERVDSMVILLTPARIAVESVPSTDR